MQDLLFVREIVFEIRHERPNNTRIKGHNNRHTNGRPANLLAFMQKINLISCMKGNKIV